MRWASVTFILGVLIAVSSAVSIKVTEYEYVATRQTRSPHGQVSSRTYRYSVYITPDGRLRMETPDKIQIVVRKSNLSYVLDKATKTYTVGPFARLEALRGPIQRSTKIGRKTIRGVACAGYVTRQADGAYSQAWTARDPASQMIVICRFYQRQPNGLASRDVLVGVEKARVSTKFFELPSGFRKSPVRK